MLADVLVVGWFFFACLLFVELFDFVVGLCLVFCLVVLLLCYLFALLFGIDVVRLLLGLLAVALTLTLVDCFEVILLDWLF